MQPPGGDNGADGFIESLDSAVGRVLRASNQLDAMAREIAKYPTAYQQDFARNHIASQIAKHKQESAMNPSAYFKLLLQGLGIFIVVLVLVFLVSIVGHLKFTEALAITCGALFFICLLAIHLVLPNPSESQQRVLRVYLAIAASATGAGLPGFIAFESKAWGTAISAGGALALFLIIYSLDPLGKKKGA